MAGPAQPLFPIFEHATGTCLLRKRHSPQPLRFRVDCKWGCLIFHDLANNNEKPVFITLQNAQQMPGRGRYRIEIKTILGKVVMLFDQANYRDYSNIHTAACGPLLGSGTGTCWDWRSINFFRIVRQLGSGGQATVNLGQRNGDSSGTLYAIKTMNHYIQDTQEIDMMFNVHHPCLMPAIDCLVEGSSYHIVMPHMNMGDMHMVSNNISYPLSEILVRGFIMQMSLGVKSLHDRGILHRDIKPDNFLVHIENNGFEIKLADFGMARQIGNNMWSTGAGTRPYLAPEIVTHRPHGRPVDIWALGCTFYEILTRQILFKDQGDTDAQVSAKILKGYEVGSDKWNLVETMTNGTAKNQLLSAMLNRDPYTRASADDVLAHPFLQ